jgi:hypothetical protein
VAALPAPEGYRVGPGGANIRDEIAIGVIALLALNVDGSGSTDCAVRVIAELGFG